MPDQEPQPNPTPSLMPWEDFDFSRLATGPLFFYVGAGLSISAGLVGWNELASLIWWYQRHYEGTKNLPACPPNDETEETAKKNAAFLQSFVTQREGESQGTPRILSWKSEDPHGLGRTALLNMMLRYRAPRMLFKAAANGEAEPGERGKELHARPGKEPSAEDLALHSLIWRSRCRGVLTTNYDMLLEHAYSLFHHGAALRSYRWNADFLRYLLSNPRFVLKLHGDINDIASMQFDPYQAWEEGGALYGQRGGDLSEVYKAILDRGHMVYVGCGFCDPTIRELHTFWQSKRVAKPRALSNLYRIALIPEDWSPDRVAGFKDIQFLTFGSRQWHEIRRFLERVVAARSGALEWRAYSEATDLYQQIFLSWDTTRPKRRLKTEPWTCRSEALRP